ncbi:hypothetical protein C0995_015609 [Termitomyces sp. Mi166|nr:hypothetical protein C0995_015609 [Termitomyces sp. Mi166\
MSNTHPLPLPPLSLPLRMSSSYASPPSSYVSLPPLSSWGAFPLPSSSSPPRSSSPPVTPSREVGGCAYGSVGVRSSPGFGLEIGREVEDVEAVLSAWRGEDDLPAKTRQHRTLPGINLLFSEELHTAHSTRLGASKLDSLQGHDCPPQHDRTTTAHDATPSNFSDSVCKYPPDFIDSEEEDDEDDSEGLSFTSFDTRATFFRISAERGQWRYDPPPQRLPALHRQSAPMSSPPPISGLNMPERPISEPLPSTSTPPPQSSHAEEQGGCDAEVSSSESLTENGNVNGVSSSDLSSLSSTSDRESTDVEMDTDVHLHERAYSPLPPSSPPLSSPSPAPILRSISPLSFAPCSPRLPPSSPLSFLDSLPPSDEQELESEHEEGEKDEDGEVQIQVDDEQKEKPTFAFVASPDVDEQSDLVVPAQEAKVEQDPGQAHSLSASTSKLPQPLSGPPEPCVRFDISGFVSSLASITSTQNPQSSALPPLSEVSTSTEEDQNRNPKEKEKESAPFPSASCGDRGDIAAVARELFGDEDEMDGSGSASGSGSDLDSLSSSVQRKVKTKFKLKDKADVLEALRTKDENGAVTIGTSKTASVKVKEKRKEEERERGEDAPPRKKVKVEASGSGSGVQKKAKKEAKRRLEEDHEEENKPAPKHKKKKVGGDASLQKRSARSETSTSKHKTSARTSSSSSSKTRLSDEAKPKSRPPPPPPPPSLKDPETEALYAEIRGMLIESMATSRASSMPASSLYKNAMRCRPSLEAQRNEKEWMEIIERVLREGEGSRGGTGVFGKVESSFKDESGRPLEAQWFYVPEMDEDQERAALIRSMMPRPAKRNETKKYKQYYYRPLAKISRWDREDDL